MLITQHHYRTWIFWLCVLILISEIFTVICFHTANCHHFSSSGRTSFNTYIRQAYWWWTSIFLFVKTLNSLSHFWMTVLSDTGFLVDSFVLVSVSNLIYHPCVMQGFSREIPRYSNRDSLVCDKVLCCCIFRNSLVFDLWEFDYNTWQ